MTNGTELSPELKSTLQRYVEIQSAEQKLLEEKQRLKEILIRYLEPRQLSNWLPEVDGQRLKVRFSQTTVVEYDEEKLRSRLGERFRSILAPDIKKIRRHLPQVSTLLEPILDIVGSPSQDRVKVAVEQGLVTKEEFTGAFQKSVRTIMAVTKLGRNHASSIGQRED